MKKVRKKDYFYTSFPYLSILYEQWLSQKTSYLYGKIHKEPRAYKRKIRRKW